MPTLPNGTPLGPNPEPSKAKRRVTGGTPGGPARTRTGLRALKSRVTVRGLAAIDRRTTAARALLDWRRELLDDLGGEPSISAARLALVEIAVRTRLYLDHIDAFLMEQSSLIVKRARLRGRLLPLVEQRQRLAESLARLLGQLGLERHTTEPLNLNDYLARRSRDDESHGPLNRIASPRPEGGKP
jgi:hypothetical protein